MKSTKWTKLKASRFQYKSERDAEAFLAKTRRGARFTFAKCRKKHSNYEWIFSEPI